LFGLTITKPVTDDSWLISSSHSGRMTTKQEEEAAPPAVSA